MLFADRRDAAERLSNALQPYSGRRPLILAIPRGALPMARLRSTRLVGWRSSSTSFGQVDDEEAIRLPGAAPPQGP